MAGMVAALLESKCTKTPPDESSITIEDSSAAMVTPLILAGIFRAAWVCSSRRTCAAVVSKSFVE
jgi:hypothetical protein